MTTTDKEEVLIGVDEIKKAPSKSASKPRNKKSRKGDIIPINGENGIIQPIVFTMMRQSYSKIQNRAVVCVVDKLQSVFHDMINRNLRFEDIQKDENAGSNGISVRIGFNEFGVSPNEYPDLREALTKLPKITIEIPHKGKDGTMYDHYTSLCSVDIPQNTYTKQVIITMNNDVSQRLISMDFGYQNLYKTVIVNNCKNKYSQRMYMMITAWQKKTKKVVMDIKNFRKWLCIENMYPEFRHVRSRVLDPAKKELEDLCKANGADCFFDYRTIFKDGRKRGEPDQIEIIIKKGVSQQSVENLDTLMSMRRNYMEMLVRHFYLSKDEASAFANKVTNDNYATAIEKIQTIYMYVNDRNNHISNTKLYALKSLENFFKDMAEPEEIE